MNVRERHDELTALRRKHPAWRLLAADNAALAIGFLESVFLTPNVRQLPGPELRDLLADHLEALRGITADGAYPKSAESYLADWSDARAGWLRRYYPAGTDLVHYEPTSAVETAAGFARSLGPREFTGTASRLLTVRDLLRQITAGTATTDPAVRLAALEQQRFEIDAQIAAIAAGTDVGLDDTAIRERFAQGLATARELLADLREVEENFRALDRDVRLRATTWTGPRGEFLETVFGSTTAIGESDQGRSWQAFWAHLLSPREQDELDRLLAAVAQVPAIASSALAIDQVLRDDLFVAAEAVQRTVASLSSQLRRFLDEQTWAEGRLIHDVIRSTLTAALAVGDRFETPPGASIDALRADIALPLERPLHTPGTSSEIDSTVSVDVDEDDDLEDLLEIAAVDLELLRGHVSDVVAAHHGRATLRQVVVAHPIEEGLAELVGYLRIAEDEGGAAIDSTSNELITWSTAQGDQRRAKVPLVVFLDPDDPATDPNTDNDDDDDAIKDEALEGDYAQDHDAHDGVGPNPLTDERQ